jgi:hypothetical protein
MSLQRGNECALVVKLLASTTVDGPEPRDVSAMVGFHSGCGCRLWLVL